MDFNVERGDSPDAGFEDAVPANVSKDGQAASLQAIAGAHQQGHDLYELVRALGQSLAASDVMALLCARLKAVVPCDSVAIFLLESEILAPRQVWGENSKVLSSLRIPLGQGVCGWVAENLKAILNGNPLVEPGYQNDPSGFSTLRVIECDIGATVREFKRKSSADAARGPGYDRSTTCKLFSFSSHDLEL